MEKYNILHGELEMEFIYVAEKSAINKAIVLYVFLYLFQEPPL